MAGILVVWAIAIIALALSGCFTAHINCPDTGSITIATSGSTAASSLLSMLGAAKMTGLMAAAPATGGGSSVDYKSLALFGGESVSCSVAGPPPPPTIITVPQGPPPPTILH